CQVVSPLDDDLRPAAEARLLARLGHKTPTQLRAAAHRVVQRLDGQAISRRVEAALRERGIAVYPTEDGLGSLSVTNLPLPVLRAVQDALRQYADAARTPDDPRTRQQRMVDCLVDLVLRPGDHGLAPVQAQLTVVATVHTLLGGDDPGEVGGDIVPAETVRALARSLGLLPGEPQVAEASTGEQTGDTLPTTTVLNTTRPDDPGPAPAVGDDVPRDGAAAVAAGLTDLLGARTLIGTALGQRPPVAVVDELTGQLLALTDATGLRSGRALGPPPPTDGYTPSAELSRHVWQRDRRCRFPGCRRPGRRCDLHHLVRWPLGDTSAENLCCLCRHHHRLVHQAPGWQLVALPGGGLRFTTPTGQALTTWPGGITRDGDRPPWDTGAPIARPPDRSPVVEAAPGTDPPPF
ncbi:MAG TPA: DUF222 domain-containing protein, partial [Modestobacter sp.]|nr:DUF222 domain-containing protein [Modestobacter sp.]